MWLAPALIHIAPTDLPYGFALRVGRAPVTLAIVDERPADADADVRASAGVLIDLLEGRIDSDTLFFRRDLEILGNTAVIVGLRNVLVHEYVNIDLNKVAESVPQAIDSYTQYRRQIARWLLEQR